MSTIETKSLDAALTIAHAIAVHTDFKAKPKITVSDPFIHSDIAFGFFTFEYNPVNNQFEATIDDKTYNIDDISEYGAKLYFVDIDNYEIV